MDVRNIPWMFLAREPLDLLTAVADEEFALRSSEEATTVALENLQLHRMFAEPKQIASGPLGHASPLSVWWVFLDNEL